MYLEFEPASCRKCFGRLNSLFPKGVDVVVLVVHMYYLSARRRGAAGVLLLDDSPVQRRGTAAAAAVFAAAVFAAAPAAFISISPQKLFCRMLLNILSHHQLIV